MGEGIKNWCSAAGYMVGSVSTSKIGRLKSNEAACGTGSVISSTCLAGGVGVASDSTGMMGSCTSSLDVDSSAVTSASSVFSYSVVIGHPW